MSGKPSPGPSVETVPEGDNRLRLVCPDCGYIAYNNPKVVVGAVCSWEERILLCRRNIPPSRGRWTIPAGFMELGETTAQGAIREVWEEAQARVRIEGLLGIYEIPHLSQVHIIYSAAMLDATCAAGAESQAVALFRWGDIPWDDLAFPSVRWSLERHREGGGPVTHTAPPIELR